MYKLQVIWKEQRKVQDNRDVFVICKILFRRDFIYCINQERNFNFNYQSKKEF